MNDVPPDTGAPALGDPEEDDLDLEDDFDLDLADQEMDDLENLDDDSVDFEEDF